MHFANPDYVSFKKRRVVCLTYYQLTSQSVSYVGDNSCELKLVYCAGILNSLLEELMVMDITILKTIHPC